MSLLPTWHNKENPEPSEYNCHFLMEEEREKQKQAIHAMTRRDSEPEVTWKSIGNFVLAVILGSLFFYFMAYVRAL